MLTYTDLTDQELSEAPADVRAVIERLTLMTRASAAAARARGLSRRRALLHAADAVEAWAREHAEPDLMWRVVVQLKAAEVLREGVRAGTLERVVLPSGQVMYRHPDQLEDTRAR